MVQGKISFRRGKKRLSRLEISDSGQDPVLEFLRSEGSEIGSVSGSTTETMECWDDRAGVDGWVWILDLHDLEEKIRLRKDHEDEKALWVVLLLGEELHRTESFRFFEGW